MNKKRIFSAILAFALTAALLPIHTFAATVTPDGAGVADSVGQGAAGNGTLDNGMPIGRIPVRTLDFGEADAEALEAVGSYEYTPYSVVSNWDDYASNYYYNRMDDLEKKVFDRMDEAAKYYLNMNVNITPVSGSYCIPVDLSGLQINVDELYDIYALFLHSNPQYFFLGTGIGYGGYMIGSEKIVTIAYMLVYNDMANGAARRAAINDVDGQINLALAAARKASSNQLGQEKAIHDWICERVAYDYYFYENINNQTFVNQYEPIHYTQSAYSVLRSSWPSDKTQHETVCAGYSQAYSLLCNALDIDTISVTSAGHQWNQTRLNGNWYIVDCTWDDIDKVSSPEMYEFYNGYFYQFFNRSTAFMSKMDQANAHVQEKYQNAYLPLNMCAVDKTCDTGDTYGVKPGTVKTSSKLSLPTSSISSHDNKICMTLSAASGCEVYYTTDGTVPTVNDGKSSLYKGEFAVSQGTKVWAIAYKNGNLDSDVLQVTVPVPSASNVKATYSVTFDANGGNASKTSMVVTKGQKYGTLPTAAKTGYTFSGWYTARTGGTKITASSTVQITEPQTLYAHWTAAKYTITYNVNGGTKLASSKRTKKVTYLSKYGTLVTPKRTGYTFSGWYTKKSGGSKITKTSTVKITKATTLYAHWTKVTVKKAAKPTLKSTKSKQLKISFRKVSGVKGYQIRYSTSAKFTKKTTRTVLLTKTSTTVKKLKSGKKYYVQVRAYKLDSASKKVYGAWSTKASKKVK